MNDAQLTELVDQKVSELCEHFDSVQILVTWESENGTGNTKDLFRGRGNWYSRAGMAREFLNRDEGQVLAREIKDNISPEGDE